MHVFIHAPHACISICIRAYVHTYYIGLCRVLYGGHVRRQHVTRCWRDVRRASRVVSSRIGRGIRAIHVAWGRGVDRARDVRDATPTPRARHHRSRPSIDRDHRSIETTDRSRPPIDRSVWMRRWCARDARACGGDDDRARVVDESRVRGRGDDGAGGDADGDVFDRARGERTETRGDWIRR